MSPHTLQMYDAFWIGYRRGSAPEAELLSKLTKEIRTAMRSADGLESPAQRVINAWCCGYRYGWWLRAMRGMANGDSR